MNILKKQISLGVFAAISLVAVPIATVVSCSKEGEDDNKHESNVIDLKKMASVGALIDNINSKLNLVMPKRADLIAAMEHNTLKESSFKEIKKYMDSMNPDKLKTLVIKSGDKEYKWDLNGLTKQIKIVKDSMDKGYSKIKSGPVINLKSDLPSAAAMVAILGGDDGTTYGMALLGFSTLEGNGYEGYNGILNAYHAFTESFTNSEIFKDWIKDKKYEIPKYSYNTKSGFKIKDISSETPGSFFDDSNFRQSQTNFLIKSKEFEENGNNFEAQWITKIMAMT